MPKSTWTRHSPSHAVAITAVGTANPIYKQHQRDVVESIATLLNLTSAEKRLLRSVYRATGIGYRYSVLSDFCQTPGNFTFFPNDLTQAFPTTALRMKIYQENALALSLLAIKNCLDQAECSHQSDITHLITVSCTGMYAPGLDIDIVYALQLNSTTKRTCINFMGCYGAFNGLKVADAICRADPNAKVLIVCVELCTLHFQKSKRMDDVISNAIFSDGAGALLIEANPSQRKYFSLKDFYCDLIPNTSQEMAWSISDQGFDIVLSSYVPEVIRSGIAGFSKKLLTRAGCASSAIDFYAIHPGGLKILKACEESLGITKEHNQYAYHVLHQYGNMSSATMIFLLKEIWNDIRHSDHDKTIFSCAFGPGLTLESMLLKIHA
ncbi:MAG: naringenin-chalcone synthase [Verrucomicrobia bacterium RIFCSPHIGHO2_12_FULL_41_10]|nr:MAG: naringenin-chalcone synthase [Verrucomicrobia bacterium RIFCSPHIGHO2_12_FULL_41_10]